MLYIFRNKTKIYQSRKVVIISITFLNKNKCYKVLFNDNIYFILEEKYNQKIK